MPRLNLSEEGDSFLDLRIVQNEEGFGAEIGLRLPAVRGRSVVVLHDVMSWGDDVRAAREFFDGIVSRRSWCDYQDICPLFAHQAKTDALPLEKYLDDDGVAIVNRLSELDARKRELKTEISTIEDEESVAKEAAISLATNDGVSRLFGKDHLLTIKDDINVDYPKSGDDRREAFKSALRDMNLLSEVSSVNGSSLKALAKKSGWLETMPEPLAPFVKAETIKTAKLGKKRDDRVAGSSVQMRGARQMDRVASSSSSSAVAPHCQ